MITLKGPRELEAMRLAGQIVATTLARLTAEAAPGVTTLQLNEIAETTIRESGAFPSFLGYNRYPASLCVSINEEVVHGIPSANRVLCEGDIVGLDVGAIVDGFHGDAAVTVPIGRVSPEASRLIAVTREALRRGILKVRSGRYLSDVSWAIQSYAESKGFQVVRQYVGHGIGAQMHEEPEVPNFGPPGRGPRLKPGMTLAVEPMVNQGTYKTVVKSDKWTVITADGRLSAHFEHTIAVTEDAPLVLTAAHIQA